MTTYSYWLCHTYSCCMCVIAAAVACMLLLLWHVWYCCWYMRDIAAVACMILLLHAWYCCCMCDIAAVAYVILLLSHVWYCCCMRDVIVACAICCHCMCYGLWCGMLRTIILVCISTIRWIPQLDESLSSMNPSAAPNPNYRLFRELLIMFM